MCSSVEQISSHQAGTRFGGDLLDATYFSYYEEERDRLMQDAKIFGASLYGDGATIKSTRMINALASNPSNPHLSLMILIALSTCKPVKRKYADYIALEMLALINRVDPWSHSLLIQLHSRSNVQCPLSTVVYDLNGSRIRWLWPPSRSHSQVEVARSIVFMK
jgi:hypothetical protein